MAMGKERKREGEREREWEWECVRERERDRERESESESQSESESVSVRERERWGDLGYHHMHLRWSSQAPVFSLNAHIWRISWPTWCLRFPVEPGLVLFNTGVLNQHCFLGRGGLAVNNVLWALGCGLCSARNFAIVFRSSTIQVQLNNIVQTTNVYLYNSHQGSWFRFINVQNLNACWGRRWAT